MQIGNPIPDLHTFSPRLTVFRHPNIRHVMIATREARTMAQSA